MPTRASSEAVSVWVDHWGGCSGLAYLSGTRTWASSWLCHSSNSTGAGYSPGPSASCSFPVCGMELMMPAWPTWAGERMLNPDSFHLVLGLCPGPAGHPRYRRSHTPTYGPFTGEPMRPERQRRGTPFTLYVPALCCFHMESLAPHRGRNNPTACTRNRGLEGLQATSSGGRGALKIQTLDSKTPVLLYTTLGCSLGTLASNAKPFPCPGMFPFCWPAMPGALTLPSWAGT